MKKILLILFIILMLIFTSGCNNTDTNSKPKNTVSQKVKINLPQDNTVNGYRISSIETATDEMPNQIPIDEVEINNNATENTDNYSKDYCGNKSSKVFHHSDCGSVAKMNDENKYFADRETLINEGYKPCGRCNP